MSKISTIYDALNALVAAELTDYARIPNPYLPADAANLVNEKGYGIAIGPGVNTDGTFCSASIDRVFNLVLIYQINAFEGDALGRANSEKALMENQFSMINIFEKDPSINVDGDNVKYLSDSGIGFLSTENNTARFFALETSFNAAYIEQLT